MNITYHSPLHRFEAFVPFEAARERETIKRAGWSWDKQRRCWWTVVRERVQPFLAACDVAARMELTVNPFEAHAAELASQGSDVELDVPAPAGLQYRGYQRAGIAYALARERVLLADEMGLGKTIQAIGCVNMRRDVRKVIILCNASLRLNWRREWARWNTTGIFPALVNTSWPREARAGLADAPMALIVSYTSVHKWRRFIDAWGPDAVICDESHALKNSKTRQARNVLGFQRPGHAMHRPRIPAKYWMLLTGTPILNRPAELWTTCRLLDPQGLGRDRQAYMMRYAESPARLGELHRLLRQRFMVRRLKADVLKELPPKTRELVTVELDDEAPLLAEQEVMEKARQRMAALKGALPQRGAQGYAEAVRELQEGRHMAMTELAHARYVTAMAKLPKVIDHLKGVLDEQTKIVVFCWHHDVLDGLRSAFAQDCVTVDGRVDPQDRQAAVDSFQRPEGPRVFLGSIRAAGLGITLTAASYVAFAELDWTPAMMMQAEDRLHRIGQDNAVLVQHIVADRSIDAKMAKMLVDKQAVIGQVLDGAPEREAAMVDELLA
ncbi:MAG: DEAD/DEAH box helicase [Pseudomonadota bacterium]